MISWVVIVLLILAGIIIIKVSHLRHKFFVIVLIFLAIFLVTSVYFIYNVHGLDLSSTKGFFSSMKIYGGWLANGFNNMKVITGNAVKMDWSNTNATFLNNTDDNPNKNKSKLISSTTSATKPKKGN
jgi:hypothetical protein